MKPKHLSQPYPLDHSFSIRRDNFPKHHNSWHYHEYLELVYINKGYGTLYLGDAIAEFNEGDCIFIGSNIPHFWLFHNLNEQTFNNSIDCIVIHFNTHFAGIDLFNIPELTSLNQCLKRATKGLIIPKNETKKLKKLFTNALSTNGVKKIISLLKIMKNINSNIGQNIISENYSILNNPSDEFRMRDVMNYIRDNYIFKIELEKLANEAKMTKNSFCRYFKQKTGKTPSQFITELRVAHSCRLLKNTKMSLKEISFASGFNNFVSFHKAFKNLLNITPTTYRNKTSPISY